MDMRHALEELFVGSDETGSSDKSWNMISVVGTAQSYWEKAYFGLEWVGVYGEESGIDRSQRSK